jgi:transposase
MRRQRRNKGKLFYEFRLDERIPQNHLLCRIDRFVTAALADLHQELEPYHGDIGRPSVDPEPVIRALIVGYCDGSVLSDPPPTLRRQVCEPREHQET